MKHQPKTQDMATDLFRCFSATRGKYGFESSTYQTFMKHSLVIFSQVKNELSTSKKKIIEESLHKAQNSELTSLQRQEHLLTAAVLLQ